ncbi:Wall-associated receptor kinase-like protein [Quillaja saponaria]|uniref:Wall-associated receptor kinase-like protein n=1 Tax=Quillaja saponaria TaxID=32244 RepID=A0AAD7KQ09_QUISA|nr:Wall-associated receptor kinase-like protein [Quillaja saponaria]
MEPTPSLLLLFCISFFLLPAFIAGQTCQRTCGKQILKFPFGSGPGCGDPRFQSYITCSQEKLTFNTHTGSYFVTSIDYTNQVIQISDPTMSTCSCTVPSKGFGLDWDAPFTFDDSTIFALLDCSMSSSPVYNSNGLDNEGNTSKLLCDQGTPICSLLYSCRPISTINLPISTCCIYTPVNLGPSFEMDLQKLQCSSYSGFYSFNGQEYNPESWKYGIALKYKFSVNNDYPILCATCERGYGVCGYTGVYNSFICNCPNGINTTRDCFFTASYDNGFRLLPWKNGIAWMIYPMAWSLIWILL